MKENGKISVLYSWPVIILALCFFWPVGLFLLIKRVSVDRKTAMSVGKLIGIFGGISYGIAVIGILACISDGFTSEDITMILFFGIAGFALRRVAKKIKTEAENIKQYLAIIINGNVRQLDNIAATTGKSYDVVKADVQKMIKKGYLENAYINENTREVVLPIASPAPAANPVFANPLQSAVAPTQPQAKIVACPCCGANNTIYGATGECEYCGSAIK
jgi:hypothetical protein